MKKALLLLTSLVLLPLSGCSINIASSSSSSSIENSSSSSEDLNVLINDIDTYVYSDPIYVKDNIQTSGITDYELTYTGNNIRIENDEIIGLKGNTVTDVTLTTKDGKSGTFEVSVLNRDYVSKHKSAETSEGWFKDVSVSKVTGLSKSSDFANGMDISSSAYLYENGAKFYDADGNEESLFYLLKDNGVNYVRLRLWNDPSDGDYLYGGGNCNLERVQWMAKEATSAGLKYLLDFHYSDFWADPSDQIVPKAWKDFTTVTQFKNAIYNYTKETLTSLKEINALPSMVQIGNETRDGMLLSLPGTGENYSENKTALSSSLSGSKNTNFVTYLNSAIKAVKEVDSSIQTMVHYVKNFADPDNIIAFYNSLSSVDYDIIGLSGYSYYHFSTLSILNSGLTAISEAFPNKKIVLAETSYGFTYESDSNANNSFSSTNDTCKPISGYACSIQGQASLYRDIVNTVHSLSNGLGVFYWEGAWLPIAKCGWGDSTTLASWSNQGFFSYNGKALGSLKVFNDVYDD
jgi:arabinogalactan endo-1,4-beta-galactosidase